MTREQAGRAAVIMTAYSSGADVQWRASKIDEACWGDFVPGNCYGVILLDPTYEWRVKPTPRGGRFCITCGSQFSFSNSEEVHNQHCRKPDVVQWVEVLK